MTLLNLFKRKKEAPPKESASLDNIKVEVVVYGSLMDGMGRSNVITKIHDRRPCVIRGKLFTNSFIDWPLLRGATEIKLSENYGEWITDDDPREWSLDDPDLVKAEVLTVDFGNLKEMDYVEGVQAGIYTRNVVSVLYLDRRSADPDYGSAFCYIPTKKLYDSIREGKEYPVPRNDWRHFMSTIGARLFREASNETFFYQARQHLAEFVLRDL